MGELIACFALGALAASLALGTWIPVCIAVAIIYGVGKFFNMCKKEEER